MKRYAEYKDSGFERIGKMPSSWEVWKLKHTLIDDKNSIRVGPFGSQLKGEDFKLDGYKVYNQRTVLDDDFLNGEAFIDEDKFAELKSFTVQPLDILITTRGTIGKIAIAPKEVDLGIIHPCIIKFTVKDSLISSKFLKYLFNDTSIIMEQLVIASNATTIPVVYSEPLKNVIFAMPTLKEQDRIISYLDQKTFAIDTLIADKQKLVDLLKEKRQAVISEAVIKGLDRNAKMKDSGIEWIGEIPDGWEVIPLFVVAKENRERNIGNSCNNLLSLSYGNIIRKDIDASFGLLPESFETYQVVERGYTILRLTDLQNDKRSLRSGFVSEKGIITSAYVGLIPQEKVDGEFLARLLHAYDIMKIFYGLGNGVRQSMNYIDLKRLPIIIPSLEEQKKIVEYLNNMTSAIDSLITDITTQIEKLKEYRQSIISEVVTGKVVI